MLNLSNRVSSALIASGVLIGIAAPRPVNAQADVLSGWKVSRNRSLTVYTPSDLQPNEAFALITEPPGDLAGKDLDEWVASRADEDVAKLGTVISKGKPTHLTKGGIDIVSCAVTYRAKNKTEPYMVAFMATRGTDGQVRLSRILSSADKSTYSRYLPTATKAVMALANSPAGSSNVASNSTSSSTKRKTARVDRSSKAYTRSGAGPKASQVLGVYSKMIGRVGVGGGMMMIHVPMVLFRDGTYFEDFDAPLADFDVAAARIARPTAWGKWRKQGNTMQIQDSKGVWDKADFYGPLPPAKPNEKLNGFYSTISGGGDTALGGTTMVVVTNDITFLPNGQFKSGRFVGGMTDQVTATSKSGTDGTYTLDGYTMTLKYRDGRVERRAFAFMDNDGSKDAMYLNGSPYLQKK